MYQVASSGYIVQLLLRRYEINFFTRTSMIVVFSDKLYPDKGNINFDFIEKHIIFLKDAYFCITSYYVIFIMKCFIFFVKHSIFFYQCDD